MILGGHFGKAYKNVRTYKNNMCVYDYEENQPELTKHVSVNSVGGNEGFRGCSVNSVGGSDSF